MAEYDRLIEEIVKFSEDGIWVTVCVGADQYRLSKVQQHTFDQNLLKGLTDGELEILIHGSKIDAVLADYADRVILDD